MLIVKHHINVLVLCGQSAGCLKGFFHSGEVAGSVEYTIRSSTTCCLRLFATSNVISEGRIFLIILDPMGFCQYLLHSITAKYPAIICIMGLHCTTG